MQPLRGFFRFSVCEMIDPIGGSFRRNTVSLSTVAFEALLTGRWMAGEREPPVAVDRSRITTETRRP